MTKIDKTTVDDAEDLNFVMPMYNLIEYRMKQLIMMQILLMMMILNFSNVKLNC